MNTPNLFILYVNQPIESAHFYSQIFDRQPACAYPKWVCFSFDNGVHIGLWSKSAKDFVSGGVGHLSEISFMLRDEQELIHLRDRWRALGVTFEEDLKKAVFGLTFVARDPDGHRIRVCLFDQ